MSKNTGNAQFRKLNVNPYSDDEEEEEPQIEGEQGPSDSEVQSLLTQNKNLDALKVVLREAPVVTKNQQIKDRALQLVMRVLITFKTSEIEGAVNALDANALDVLMKYIYRGFECPSEDSSAQLLRWHEKAFAVGGLGSIVRVLTDRKRV